MKVSFEETLHASTLRAKCADTQGSINIRQLKRSLQENLSTTTVIQVTGLFATFRRSCPDQQALF